ncbi:MAG: sporulation protein YunB [Oscillospiraceae bacterium]
MRFRTFKRRLVFNARTNARAVGTIILCFTCAVLLISAAMIFSHFRPMVVEMALATATDDITLAVNNTVSEKMSELNISYENLVTLEKDNSGHITALVTNIANINILQSEITNAIVEHFAETDITSVSIPLGNLIGGTLLSGKGPRITVDILSVTNVTTSFRNEFTSAGINQTRHQIMMDVEVTLGILLAGSSETDTVLTEVSIAETVIVGTVPNTYATLE